MLPNLVIINTVDEMVALQLRLPDDTPISFDTETTGLDRSSSVIGFSVCWSLEEAYYVILSYWDVASSKLVDLPTKASAKEFLTCLQGRQLIAHNAVFDCMIINANFNIDLMPSIFADTLIMAQLLDETRPNGLKDLAVSLYGEDSRKEQLEMKESVTKNGGALTKACYELYKGDASLIAKYGAQDTILTLKLFYTLTPQLYDQGLDSFYFDEESMPLLRGPTYELNTIGLKVDTDRLQTLRRTLETEILEDKAFIYKEIDALIKDKYPASNKKTTFNIGSPAQLSWLVFVKMERPFGVLTDGGKEVCKALGMKLPYDNSARRRFVSLVQASLGSEYMGQDSKGKSKLKKVREVQHYLSSDKETLEMHRSRYKWVDRYLNCTQKTKLLSTYVIGIGERLKYGVIRPEFLQHGTTSGRYSSRKPNFQNLPRKDKRVKACIIARPGKTFVGADYSQLEPRVFSALSGDEALQGAFARGEDFYAVVGVPVWNKQDATLFKEGPNAFAEKYPEIRDSAKILALAVPYGKTAGHLAQEMKISKEEAQEVMDSYLAQFPKVKQLMLDSYEQVKTKGIVYSLFGRPRRIPAALDIGKMYGKNTPHDELPYAARNLLNLAMNHPIQSTGASIMNRAAIRFYSLVREAGLDGCHIVMQVHDELIIECFFQDSELVAALLKEAMENTTFLPGVALQADPKIADNIAGLK